MDPQLRVHCQECLFNLLGITNPITSKAGLYNASLIESKGLVLICFNNKKKSNDNNRKHIETCAAWVKRENRSAPKKYDCCVEAIDVQKKKQSVNIESETSYRIFISRTATKAYLSRV